MKNSYAYLIALLSGAIGVFAFSPFNFWPLAYLSVLGLLFVTQLPNQKTALKSSFLWGMGFFTFGINWIHISIYQFGGVPLALSYVLVLCLATYLALYPLLFSYILRKFRIQSFMLFPIIWTLVEWLRANLFSGFPWLQFGYSQIDSPFAGIAPIFGVEGLTFFVIWISAIAFNLIKHLAYSHSPKWRLIMPSTLLILLTSLGAYSQHLHFVQPNKNAEPLRVALLQGNTPQQLKWNPAYFRQTVNTYSDLIAKNIKQAKLIVLPEAAFPLDEKRLQPLLQSIQTLASQQGAEVLIGSLYFNAKQGKIYNSIIDLGNPTYPYTLNTSNRYNKHHLVPFGEYVPLENLLRPLGTIFDLPMSAFQSGPKVQPNLFAKNHHFAPAICYEIIFGSQLQQNIQKNTDFIITLSNDTWFGNSIGPWQHFQMARMRALELGKPLIRATNNGITALVDGYGKVQKQIPQFIESTLQGDIRPTIGHTPYAVLGNKPLYLLMLLSLIFNALGAFIKYQLAKLARNAKDEN